MSTGPIGHKLTVIRITAGYIKTIGEGLGGKLPLCSSATSLLLILLNFFASYLNLFVPPLLIPL
jgi:ABC-type multidrug transport system permease subunit